MAKMIIMPTPQEERTALNRTHVIFDAAGTFYLPAAQFWRIGAVNWGIQIQAVGNAVVPHFTLGDPKTIQGSLGTNGNVQDTADAPTAAQMVKLAALPWMAQSSIAANAIGTIQIACTIIKLVAAGAGEAIIVSW